MSEGIYNILLIILLMILSILIVKTWGRFQRCLRFVRIQKRRRIIQETLDRR